MYHAMKCILQLMLRVIVMVKLAGFIKCILQLKIEMYTGCWDEVTLGWNAGLRIRTEKLCQSFGIVLVWDRAAILKFAALCLFFSYDKIE